MHGLPTWQLNGVVWSQVVVGNTVYATGRFTQARPPGVVAGGRGTVPARNIFAYDIRTGNRVASCRHSLNAQGLALTRSPDGKRVYVVGDFTRVDSHKRSHVAAFDTATNALDRAFVPTISASAAAVTASNHKVWVGGNFFNANGSARWRLAAFRAGNGRLLSWAPRANDEQVTSMVLAPGGSRVIIGGRFSTINGHRAPAMASVDSVTGALRPWAINTRINDAGHSSGITSLSTDGTSIFGTGFAYRTGHFEGTFSARPNTGAPNWVNDCHGDTYAAVPIGRVLYTVSHAYDCEWMGAFPRGPEEWVNQRRALAFSTASSGRTGTGPDSYGWNYAGLPVSSLLHWFPVLSPGTFTGQHQAAWSVAGNHDYVVLGGEFRSVNGIAQSGLVRFAVRAKAPNRQAPSGCRVHPAPPPSFSRTAPCGSLGRPPTTWTTHRSPTRCSAWERRTPSTPRGPARTSGPIRCWRSTTPCRRVPTPIASR